MNELDTFETLRPNVRPLSPEQQATMRSQLFGDSDHVATTVIDHDRPLDLDADAMQSAPRSRRSHQRLLGVAAAAIAITGIAGIWAFESNRQDQPAPAQESSASEPIEPTAATVGQTLVPDDLATLGVSLTPAGLQTDRQAERSGVQRRVYGSAADPGDPAQMVTLTYAADMNDGRVPCEFVDGASSFEIADDTGWLCQTGSTTSAGWIVDGVAVELSADRGLSSDDLVAVARSLRTVSPPETGEGPEIDLEPDPLPSGWTTLVGTDLPFEQALLETSWLATSDGDPNNPHQLWVRSWTGDDAAVYAFAPVESQRTVVRGRPGYLYQSSQEAQNGPIDVTVTWIENPGLVISVSLANPSGVAADLLTNLESWRPADTATFPLTNEVTVTTIADEQPAPSAPAAHLPAEELFVAAALAPDQTKVDSYDRAVAAHRTTCMAGAGFTDAPELAPVAVSADFYTPIVDFLYFDDPANIAQYGYYWPNRFGTSVGTTEQQSTANAEVSAALDRCNQPVIAIQQQAYRENNLDGVVLDMIDAQIFDRVNLRPEVGEKYTDWKRCMSDAGYPTARLRESVTSDYSPTIDQATTDASCRATTGYTNAVVAAQADEVATWLASNHDTVEAFEQLWIDLAAGAAQLN
ncbi:MAG TPA: hypothetical protein VES40_22115 [Ilumatobacteraceae bacterium]|nr:hypothetical protein [Ilumatobacteraceae bacterium]